MALALGLALGVTLTLGAQDSKTREPKRPKLDAGRDTNSAAAYHLYGMQNLSNRPRSAADAFYWATRLDPSLAEPWYGRWCALLLAMQRRDLFAVVGEEPRYSKDVAKIDSLRYEALLREPLLYTKLDAVIVHDFFSTMNLATGGEVSEMDLASVRDPGMRGWLAYGSGRFGESVQQYAIAITQRPKAHLLHANRARAFIPMLQYDSAAAEFEAERMLQQRGESTLVRVYNSKEMLEYSIGRVRESQGNDQGARDAYGRALVENLAFYPGHIALARLAMASGDTATALKEYDLAAQLAPDRADIRYVYGVLLMGRQRFDEAAEQFRLAVEADSFYVGPYYLLGYIREGQGKDSLAIAYYSRFIAAAPVFLASQVDDARKRLNDVKRVMSESR